MADVFVNCHMCNRPMVNNLPPSTGKRLLERAQRRQGVRGRFAEIYTCRPCYYADVEAAEKSVRAAVNAQCGKNEGVNHATTVSNAYKK